MSLVVRTGPQEYECGIGVLDSLTSKLKARGIRKAVIVHGTNSWKRAETYLSHLINSEITLEFVAFNGECTYEEVNRIVERLKETHAEAIIGVGGGKLMDTVKYAAEKITGVQSILIPTLASNCAPWTPLSVMYTADGVCLGFDIHMKQVALLAIEPSLLLDAPVNYFVAGVADTLAKWYESDVILSRPEHQTNALLLISRAAALNCRDTIVNYGQQAVADIQTHSLTPAFIQVCETIIAVSGLVGGLGDEYARTTIAHAVHDKLTIFPETHVFLHGEKVAYGIMVQLAFEEKWVEVARLAVFYESLQLPKTLTDLNLSRLTDDQLAAFTASVALDNNLIQSGYEAAKEDIQKAIHSLEDYLGIKVVSETKMGESL
ncbi:iron-containing alcohol dehydrogenase family protein [Carnobacterium sp. CS13]|uniref:iron-containing alcohol dehydrogenase family protein n=1 Tax=Carnobacterium sp. CS13 TaxID=2800128 RepID=UPI0019137FBC|nr:iron-containing alcohol dehydrogenase family protein [Carnobacterium sp. CS13]QQP70046.1 iron-containing alcohol dehydrogenase family protein [Carnobacterium sp. CS13]